MNTAGPPSMHWSLIKRSLGPSIVVFLLLPFCVWSTDGERWLRYVNRNSQSYTPEQFKSMREKAVRALSYEQSFAKTARGYARLGLLFSWVGSLLLTDLLVTGRQPGAELIRFGALASFLRWLCSQALRYWQWLWSGPPPADPDATFPLFLWLSFCSLLPLAAVGLAVGLLGGIYDSVAESVVGATLFFATGQLILLTTLMMNGGMTSFRQHVWPEVARQAALAQVAAFYRQHESLRDLYPPELFTSMVQSALPQGDVGDQWAKARDLIARLKDAADTHRPAKGTTAERAADLRSQIAELDLQIKALEEDVEAAKKKGSNWLDLDTEAGKLRARRNELARELKSLEP